MFKSETDSYKVGAAWRSANYSSRKKACKENPSPWWLLKESSWSECTLEKTSALGESGWGYSSLKCFSQRSVLCCSLPRFVLLYGRWTRTHAHLSLSFPGVKSTNTLWLNSTLIYFTCSNLISSFNALNKNRLQYLFFLIVSSQIFFRAVTLHKGVRLLHFWHNLAVEQLSGSWGQLMQICCPLLAKLWTTNKQGFYSGSWQKYILTIHDCVYFILFSHHWRVWCRWTSWTWYLEAPL